LTSKAPSPHSPAATETDSEAREREAIAALLREARDVVDRLGSMLAVEGLARAVAEIERTAGPGTRRAGR